MNERERERQILDRLRDSYESDGYQFFVEPPERMLPSALGGYRPDAIAVRNGESLLIEVKTTRGAGDRRYLADVTRRVEELGTGWKLVVFYVNEWDGSYQQEGAATPAMLLTALEEVRSLSAAGHNSAALVIGLSILEAVARKAMSEDGKVATAPLSPVRAVDFLEQSGELDFEHAAQLRSLARLRNAIVHGDFSQPVGPAMVTTLLDCITPLVGPDLPEAAE